MTTRRTRPLTTLTRPRRRAWGCVRLGTPRKAPAALLASFTACCLLLYGCIATADQRVERPTDAGDLSPVGAVVQQAGGGIAAPVDATVEVDAPVNAPGWTGVAAPVDATVEVDAPVNAPGWTGVAVSEAMPVGLAVLLVLIVVLSHRREMTRIRCERH